MKVLQHVLNFINIFIISDVIPLFVFRKTAIFCIQFNPFLVTRSSRGTLFLNINRNGNNK